jgi:hypothetical protein
MYGLCTDIAFLAGIHPQCKNDQKAADKYGFFHILLSGAKIIKTYSFEKVFLWNEVFLWNNDICMPGTGPFC